MVKHFTKWTLFTKHYTTRDYTPHLSRQPFHQMTRVQQVELKAPLQAHFVLTIKCPAYNNNLL